MEYEKLEGHDMDTGEAKYATMSSFHHTKNPRAVLTVPDVPEFIQAQFQEIEEFEAHNGSGWKLKKVIKLIIGGNSYQPIRGASWVKTPPLIAKKKACINVKNSLPGNSRTFDKKCFLWSVLAALHPADSHVERVTNYSQFEGST